jgi:hypothetical protein
MLLKLEDCVDVIKHLYAEYDYLFLFDHSSGHDEQREDGLTVKKMARSYGGTQHKLRGAEGEGNQSSINLLIK